MEYLTSLKVFCAVAERGSFVAAARMVRLSKAAVTKHVNALEDRLKIRLLHRSTRHIGLTEAGARFYAHCTGILGELDEAEREAGQAAAEPSGTLRVSVPCPFGSAHVAPLIHEFQRSCPDVTIELRQCDGEVDPIEEGLDLAIRTVEQLPESSLVARRLATGRQIVCGAPEYFARHGEPHTPDDLGHHSCLGGALAGREHDWTFLCADGGRHLVRVRGAVRSNSSDLLRAATLGGAGIALLPTFMVGEDLRAGRLQAVLTDYRLPEFGIFAVYPSRKHPAAKVTAFISFLAEKWGARPYWDEWAERLPRPTEDACAAGAQTPRAPGGRIVQSETKLAARAAAAGDGQMVPVRA